MSGFIVFFMFLFFCTFKIFYKDALFFIIRRKETSLSRKSSKVKVRAVFPLSESIVSGCFAEPRCPLTHQEKEGAGRGLQVRGWERSGGG